MVVNVSIVKSLRYIYLHRANWHPNLHFLKEKNTRKKKQNLNKHKIEFKPLIMCNTKLHLLGKLSTPNQSLLVSVNFLPYSSGINQDETHIVDLRSFIGTFYH